MSLRADAAATRYADALDASAVSMPVGIDPDGLPVGIQIVGSPDSDACLLAIARALEGIVERFPVPPSRALTDSRR